MTAPVGDMPAAGHDTLAACCTAAAGSLSASPADGNLSRPRNSATSTVVAAADGPAVPYCSPAASASTVAAPSASTIED